MQQKIQVTIKSSHRCSNTVVCELWLCVCGNSDCYHCRPEARVIKEALKKLRDRNPKTFVVEEASSLKQRNTHTRSANAGK